MTSHTVATSLGTGITLSAGGSYASPLTITAAGSVVSANGTAIYSAAAASISNDGGVTGAYAGIFLDANGDILNAGRLGGTDFGVAAVGYVSLSNSGSIGATLETLVTVSNAVFAGIGVDLLGGGNVTNQFGGTITGVEFGLGFFNDSAVIIDIDNRGLIAASGTTFVFAAGETTSSEGVFLVDGGTLTNEMTGTIAGYAAGVQSSFVLSPAEEETRNNTVATSIDNAGLIESGVSSDIFNNGTGYGSSGGVVLNEGGALTNEQTGRISGNFGVYLNGGSDSIVNTIDNLGTITGVGNFGVALGENASMSNSGQVYGFFYGALLLEGNAVTNQSGGTITGGHIGVLGLDGGTIVNAGQIGAGGSVFQVGTVTADATAVDLLAAGTFSNAAGGEVSGYLGAYFTAGGLLSNAGTITGRDGVAAYFAGTASGRVELMPGGVFNGLVDDNGNNGVIDLGSAAARGVLSGLGDDFVSDTAEAFLGFENITIDPGAQWLLTGTDVLDAGQTLSDFGTLTVAGSFTNDGLIITDPSTIYFDSAVTGAGTIEIGAGSDVVFDGSVASTETIVFQSSTGTLTINDPSQFDAAVVGTGTEDIACSLIGTHIATDTGAVAVENLRIGDRLPTLDAGVQKIKWIGRRNYIAPFAARNHLLMPVCIKAGAIEDLVPDRDLWVSPGHAICIDGVLVHALRLINGVSITQARDMKSITYFHIEMEHHEIIVAENCPVETFMDESFRRQFHNAAEFSRLYPGQKAAQTMCRQRIDSGFALAAIQRRLTARAGVGAAAAAANGPLRGFLDCAGPDVCFGWAQDILMPEQPVCLDILADGQQIGRTLANLFRADIRDAGLGSGCQGFEFLLPPGTVGPISVRRTADRAALAFTEAALAA